MPEGDNQSFGLEEGSNQELVDNRPVVFIDFDDTLSKSRIHQLGDTNQRLMDAGKAVFKYREAFGTGAKPDQDFADLRLLWHQQPEIAIQAEPFVYADKAVNKLAGAGYRPVIVSLRPQSLHQATTVWLKRHGYLESIADEDIVQGSPELRAKFKTDLIEKYHPVAVFDDSAEIVEAFAQEGIINYMITRPWNEHLRGKAKLRVREDHPKYKELKDLEFATPESDDPLIRPVASLNQAVNLFLAEVPAKIAAQAAAARVRTSQ